MEVRNAPVSGGMAQRREGRLSVMVGGDGATLARARPVLEAIGERIFRVGRTGAGATMKLVNNLLNGIGAVATSAIRDFRGAMVGRADKGLFMTTSRFTKDAEREAVRDATPPIDLIDGIAVCDLLRRRRLGVKIDTVEVVTPIPEVSRGSDRWGFASVVRGGEPETFECGAQGGSRTLTPLWTLEPKSSPSTDSGT